MKVWWHLYCNICQQFQIQPLETLKYLIHHANRIKLVSVRVITPVSAHCEKSCSDELAAACRGMPQARGPPTVWKRLTCYHSSSGTKVTTQHDCMLPCKRNYSFCLHSLTAFCHFMGKKCVPMKCNPYSSHRKFTVFSHREQQCTDSLWNISTTT